MYKDIAKTVEAFTSLEKSISNNRVSREQVEDLSAGMLSDNINIEGESLARRFEPSLYSRSSSSISLDDAVYIKNNIKGGVYKISLANKVEALKSTTISIRILIDKLEYISSAKDVDMDMLTDIKNYFNRHKVDLALSQGNLIEDVSSSFIPFNIYNNRDQIAFFKKSSDRVSRASNILEEILTKDPIHFYPVVNWILAKIVSKKITHDWSLLFNTVPITPINIVLLAECLINGEVVLLLKSLLGKLEEELSDTIMINADVFKTLTLDTDVKNADPIDRYYVFSNMHKDNISTLIIELIASLLFSKNK